jgi:hypothetical protein
MTPDALSDPYLDQMRGEGDPLADECVAAIFARHDVDKVRDVMKALVRDVGVPTEGLPDELRDYLDAFHRIDRPPQAATLGAQDVFSVAGPEILLVLGFYSLPASYAAAKGVKVLARTARLVDGPLRRVFETTQMVVDVMTPKGLEPGGVGLATVSKVRLMHAAVRHMLLQDKLTPWDTVRDGVPINQEDLAGTLSTFSTLILDGLERLHIPMSAADQLAWIRCWSGIGRLLGLREELLPSDVEEARALTKRIQQRQINPSPEGRELIAALLPMYEKLFEWHVVSGLPATLMREFLPKDVANGLDVPKANYTRVLAWGLDAAMIFSLSESWAKRLFRRFSLRFIQGMLDRERGGTRPSFTIPDHLADGWREA